MSLSQTFFRVAQRKNEPLFFIISIKKSIQKSIMKSLRFSRNKTFCTSDLDHYKETPFCTSFHGSYTIEAAIVLPLFISLCVFILFFLRIAMVQIGVTRGLEEVAAKTAVCCGKEEIHLPVLILAANANIVAKKTPVFYITGGILGISYEKSSVEDNYVVLTATYDILFPIQIFGKMQWHMQSSTSWRKWIGWDDTEEQMGNDFVYVTARGSVYHARYDCSYLHPAIVAVDAGAVEKLRNADGSRYAPCRTCKSKKTKKGVVYITDYGENYHSRLSCGGLKRTIYRRHRSEVAGMQGCKKCVCE